MSRQDRQLLERIWQQPPAARPLAPIGSGRIAAAPEPPTPPPPRPAGPRLERHTYQPCPPDARRQRLAAWAAAGLLPEGVPAASIAAAYRRVFGGAEPRRDPERKQTRCYSRREVRGCLWLLRREGREVVR